MSTLSEFTLIQQYFQKHTADPDIILGIGDDAAIVTVPENQQLVVCVDTIVSGQHFLSDTPAVEIGHRALAVNLSDIAAMGAIPRWFTLGLTLPQADENWLSEFSRGLFTLAQAADVHLIGGDTTQGALTISIQVLGLVPAGQALTRNKAQIGDKIYVTGTVGDAGLGLQMLREQVHIRPEYQAYLRQRYQHPQPRLQVGKYLRGLATSAIDISDGLAADLNHILQQSGVGADIETQKIPLSPALRASVDKQSAIHLGLTAGDDYELCFTLPAEHASYLSKLIKASNVPCTCIGEITVELGLRIKDESGVQLKLEHLGWECLRASPN